MGHRSSRVLGRAWPTFVAVALVTASLGVALVTQAGAADAVGLTGERLEPGVNATITDSSDCNPAGTTTHSFSVSGTATGPYAGTFTESGSFSVGPQTDEFVPGQFRGPITAFDATFTITSSAGTVDGTAHLTDATSGLNAGGCVGTASTNTEAGQITVTGLTWTATVTSAASGTFTDSGDPGSSQVSVNWNVPAPPTGFFRHQFLSDTPSGVPVTNALTVTRTGHGAGAVTSSPSGISCGGDGVTCVANFDAGTSVILTATPGGTVGADGSILRASDVSVFAGWTGDCATATANTCTVSMDAARAVTAQFALAPNYGLAVTKTGPGSGSVVSAPAGIACGATCAATFVGGTAVTLTPTADAGSAFTGWSGACSGSGACVVTMDARKAVSANFVVVPPPRYQLTVTEAGNGRGSVTSAPAGISCPPACGASYLGGTTVTLTATRTPDNKYTSFAGWGGACSGTAPTCTVAMNAAQNVTATFTATQYRLDIQMNGLSGGGEVVHAGVVPGGGFTCSRTCTTYAFPGAIFTLTSETPRLPGNQFFIGWSGACTGTTPTCTIKLTSDQTVTATWITLPPILGKILGRIKLIR